MKTYNAKQNLKRKKKTCNANFFLREGQIFFTLNEFFGEKNCFFFFG